MKSKGLVNAKVHAVICCNFVSAVLSFISSYYSYSYSCSCSYRRFFHIKCDLVNHKRPLRIWPMMRSDDRYLSCPSTVL